MRTKLATLLCLPALCLPLAGQDATQAETEALVKEAIAFAKTNGKEAAIKEITKVGGKFHRHGGELYVFIYDMDGKVVRLYALTLAPVTWVLLSEIFPNRVRGLAMSAGTTVCALPHKGTRAPKRPSAHQVCGFSSGRCRRSST